MTAVTDRPVEARGPSFAPVAVVLVAIPALWGLRLVVNFALASYFCFPGATRFQHIPPGAGWVWPLLVALDLVTMLAAAAAAILCTQVWQAAREALRSAEGPLQNAGKARTRFLALWGAVISGGTVVAVLFDFVGLWVIPACG